MNEISSEHSWAHPSQEGSRAADRCVGALVGLAVGDALGTTLEFSQRDALPPVTGMVGGGPFNLEAGQWTDDTSMALCLAMSMLETSQFDLRSQLDYFSRWVNEGYLSSTGECFDIGHQTLYSLADYTRTGQLVSSRGGGRSSGNGSIMRIAPVGIIYRDDLSSVAKYAAVHSLTTHPTAECQEACACWAVLIAAAINGYDRGSLFGLVHQLSSCVEDSALQSIMAGSFREKTRDDILSSGYVIHTLEAALWAFAHTESYAEGALLAVNLGDDADTVGAVYGQLAGAFYGQSSIPTEWREKLYRGTEIAHIACALNERRAEFTVTSETAQLSATHKLRLAEREFSLP